MLFQDIRQVYYFGIGGFSLSLITGGDMFKEWLRGLVITIINIFMYFLSVMNCIFIFNVWYLKHVAFRKSKENKYLIYKEGFKNCITMFLR